MADVNIYTKSGADNAINRAIDSLVSSPSMQELVDMINELQSQIPVISNTDGVISVSTGYNPVYINPFTETIVEGDLLTIPSAVDNGDGTMTF